MYGNVGSIAMSNRPVRNGIIGRLPNARAMRMVVKWPAGCGVVVGPVCSPTPRHCSGNVGFHHYKRDNVLLPRVSLKL